MVNRKDFRPESNSSVSQKTWNDLEKLMYKVARKKGLNKNQAHEVSQISNKQRKKFQTELQKGALQEAKEHKTLTKAQAEQVASDHLKENPAYYDKTHKAQLSSDKGYDVPESIKKGNNYYNLYDAFEDRESAIKSGKDSGYDSIVRKDDYGDNGRLKYGVYILEKSSNTLSEKDIRKLKARYDSGENPKIIRESHKGLKTDNGYDITTEQTEKGLRFLKSNKSQLQYRENNIVNNFESFKLRDFYSPDGKNYYPYYEVRSKPDKDGHRDIFEYYYDGRKIHILG